MTTSTTNGSMPGKVTPNKKAAGGKTTTATKSICNVDSTGSLLIQAHGRNLWTTSMMIAAKFGKRHSDVIRAIAKLECPGEFSLRNFALRDYIDERGKLQKSYDISRDGFSLLGMGFTGKAAAKWKVQFIEAFGTLERELLRIANRKHDPALRIASNEKSAAAILMTDCVKDARADVGKTCAHHHFSNEHSLCNWVLTGRFEAINQDNLDCVTMRQLTVIRRRNSVLILKMHDYANRKAKLREEFPLTAAMALGVAQ